MNGKQLTPSWCEVQFVEVFMCRDLRLALLSLPSIFLALSGCSTDPAKSFAAKFQSAAAREVEFTTHYHEEIWKHVPGHFNKWRKEKSRISPETVSYDVRKSESLVTPFVATVEFRRDSASGPLCATREESAASDPSEWKLQPQDKCRAQYGYQDGKWVLRKVEFFMDTAQKNGWFPLDSGEWIEALTLDGVDLKD